MKSLVKSLITPFLTEIDSLPEEKTIGLFGGGFQPPTKGHFEVVKKAIEMYPNLSKFIIYVGTGGGRSEDITQSQALAIWDIYKDHLSRNIEILPSPNPISSIYRYAKEHQFEDIKWFLGSRAGNEQDFDSFHKHSKSTSTRNNLEAINIITDKDVSGTKARQVLNNKDELFTFLPDELSDIEREAVYNILKPSIQELFEPSSNSYEYDQVTSLDYTFMSDYGRIYVVGITPESEGRISIDFGIEDEYGDISFPETNERDVFKIIATVSNIVKDYLSKHPDIEIISWSSVAKKGEKKIGDTQRDKLYKLVVKRQGNLKDEDIVRKDTEYWAYLKGYNPMFEETIQLEEFKLTIPEITEQVKGDSIICDNCGWTWKIADGGDDLYICHKCGHDNTPKQTSNFFEPLDGKNIEQPTNIEKIDKHLENNLEFKEALVSLTMYLMDHISIEPLPDLIFIEDDAENANDLLGKTAYYNPENKSITLYTLNRHPKDILRSYAHEMIHHKQNLEGKLTDIQGQNINEDEYLKELEAEAYKYGNGLLFRGWENSR